MAYDVSKIWADIHWLERKAEEKRDIDPEQAGFYLTKAEAKREVLEDMGLEGTEAGSTATMAGFEFRQMVGEERRSYAAEDGHDAWISFVGDVRFRVAVRRGMWHAMVESFSRGMCWTAASEDFETAEQAAEAAMDKMLEETSAEDADETVTLAGHEFRPQDADERNWYLADDGFGAWVCETEEFVAAVEHSDGCWRCEVTWGEEYVNGGAREFGTPEEAVEAVFAAYEGVRSGTVDAWEWR